MFEEQARHMPRYMRPLIALLIMVLVLFAAERIGIIALVSQGYSFATYIVLCVFIIPLLTRGLWSLYQSPIKEKLAAGSPHHD